VARYVGHGRKVGAQAAGARRRRTWKDLTDNVNPMASNRFTGHVRNIADVATAISPRRSQSKESPSMSGRDPNSITPSTRWYDPLSRVLPAEVTRVAREVARKARFGGQAMVPRGIRGPGMI